MRLDSSGVVNKSRTMQHRKSIELVPDDHFNWGLANIDPMSWMNFEQLQEWYVLGGSCAKCQHQGWVDRRDLAWRYGRRTQLATLAGKLRCRQCGNKVGNRWIIGKLAR